MRKSKIGRIIVIIHEFIPVEEEVCQLGGAILLYRKYFYGKN